MPLRTLKTVILLIFVQTVTACRSPAAPTLVPPAVTPVPAASETPASAAAAIETTTQSPSGAMATPTTTSTPQIVPSLTVTLSPTPTAGDSLTSTPDAASATPWIHVVTSGETLTSIAAEYGVTIEEIMESNDLEDRNNIWEGQVLTIGEAGTSAAATPSLTPMAQGSADASATDNSLTVTPMTGPPDLPPSSTDGTGYPLTQISPSGSIRIHYQPGTYPEATMETLAPMLDQILFELQQAMGKFLDRQVDVYLAGTLFAQNPALQGLSVSREYRTSVLVNGAFHQGEEYYILGHELTHVAATNLLGPASSTMIHEGLATYLPQKYLVQQANYLPIYEICAAAQQTDAFIPASTLIQYGYGANGFGGHIRTFFHYNLAGCFAGYLVETYGMGKMDAVYDSGDYYNVYGMTLAELDEAWQQWLSGVDVSVNAQAFVDMVETVANAYEQYVRASVGGRHANYPAYLHLNRARLATNQGALDEAQTEIDHFWDLFAP